MRHFFGNRSISGKSFFRLLSLVLCSAEPPHSMPSLRYVFTWNNYDDESYITCKRFFDERCSYLCYGKEIGDKEHTPHLQGYFELIKATKFNTLTKELPCGYIKTARKPPINNYEYCSKQLDFTEYGTISESHQGSRTDLEEFKNYVVDSPGVTYNELLLSHPEICANYPHYVKNLLNTLNDKENRETLNTLYTNCTWKPWQQEIIDICSTTPNRRTVHWFWESIGDQGKSFLTTYLTLQFNACVLAQGKKADLAHIWASHQGLQNVVIFDLPRTVIDGDCGSIKHLLSLAEEMKNGCVISTKYDSRMVLRPSPHVIFFANQPPPMGALSRDRWNVKEIH